MSGRANRVKLVANDAITKAVTIAPGMFSAAQLQYMVWLCVPPSKRVELGVPASEAALAEDLGVSPRTLYYWKANPAFIKARTVMSFQLLQYKLPDIVNAALENMLTPEGWQERVALFRYLLPMLNDMEAANLFDVVNIPNDQQLLSPNSIKEELEKFPAELRGTLLEFAEKVLQNNSAENNPVQEENIYKYFYGTEKNKGGASAGSIDFDDVIDGDTEEAYPRRVEKQKGLGLGMSSLERGRGRGRKPKRK